MDFLGFYFWHNFFGAACDLFKIWKSEGILLSGSRECYIDLSARIRKKFGYIFSEFIFGIISLEPPVIYIQLAHMAMGYPHYRTKF